MSYRSISRVFLELQEEEKDKNIALYSSSLKPDTHLERWT